MDDKILIIEDNEQDKKIFKRYLGKLGFTNIKIAKNGEEGINYIREEMPDLVILDTILPDMVGFDICQKIRDEFGPDNPKIIITTGSIDAVDALRARQAGANDYCVKAMDCGPLLGALKSLYPEIQA